MPQFGGGPGWQPVPTPTRRANKADAFAPAFRTIDPNEDRFVVQHNNGTELTFRYHDGRVAMTLLPGWGLGDRQADSWMTGFAVHFNSTPSDLGYDARLGQGGVSGIASVDTYTQPSCAATCRLAVGPTYGPLSWRVQLTR